MSALQESACLKRMTPAPNVIDDAAIIQAFAGIPALLEQDSALIFRGRTLDCECLLGPVDHPFHVSIRGGSIVDLTPARVLIAAIDGASVTITERLGHFPMSENPEQFRRYIAPVLGRILEQSTSTKQGEHA